MARRSSFRTSCLLAAALLCQAASLRNRGPRDPFSVYDGHDLLKVTACNKTAVRELRSSLARANCRILSEPGLLIMPHDGNCAVAQATCPPEAGELRPTGSGVELLAEASAGELMRRRGSSFLTKPMVERSHFDLARNASNDTVFYEEFRPYDSITDRLKSMVHQSGGAAELVELDPPTVEGRRIQAVRLRGKKWQPGSPRVIFTYTLHAREWISTMSGVYAAEQAIQAATEDPERFEGLEMTFIPVSNPDGFVHSYTVDRFWRKNKAFHSACRGVDLNRNFGWQWGRSYADQDSFNTADSCGEVFHGPAPASEPETQALQDLVEAAPVSVLLDFHSCGGFILGSWSFMPLDHPRNQAIQTLGNGFREAIQSYEGSNYTFCTGNTCLYPVSGDLPDYATALGGLGFTIEMRPLTGRYATYDDFAPEPHQILPNAKENYNAAKVAIQWATTGSTDISE